MTFSVSEYYNFIRGHKHNEMPQKSRETIFEGMSVNYSWCTRKQIRNKKLLPQTADVERVPLRANSTHEADLQMTDSSGVRFKARLGSLGSESWVRIKPRAQIFVCVCHLRQSPYQSASLAIWGFSHGLCSVPQTYARGNETVLVLVYQVNCQYGMASP
jgi:hypothetical protein